jgi:phosphoglycolate phosphatase
MFQNKELIIFDMDGTLIDSAPSLAFAVNSVLKELGREPFELSTVRQWIGNGADILIKRALVGDKMYENYTIDNQLFQKAKQLFLSTYGANLNAKTVLYSGVKSGLERLSKNYTLALATNKPIEFVGEMLEHFSIREYFAIYYGAGSVENKKPNPQMLLELCKVLNIQTEKSVMVGDSRNDLLAANAAKIDPIAVSYGYNQGENLENYKPKLICHSFPELLPYFNC